MKEGRMVLAHKPVPIYRKAFYIVVLLGFLYLGIIFLKYMVLWPK